MTNPASYVDRTCLNPFFLRIYTGIDETSETSSTSTMSLFTVVGSTCRNNIPTRSVYGCCLLGHQEDNNCQLNGMSSTAAFLPFNCSTYMYMYKWFLSWLSLQDYTSGIYRNIPQLLLGGSQWLILLGYIPGYE